MKYLITLLLLLSLGTTAQKLPTTGLRMTDVYGVIPYNRLTNQLYNSTDSYFDVAYKGSKDRLNNFRNYGPPAASAPTVTSDGYTSTGCTTLTASGTVSSDGGAAVTARGIAYGTSSNPTIAGGHTTNGSGTGSFGAGLTGLDVTTSYFFRAYATNSVGTSYGANTAMSTALDIYPYGELTSVFVGVPSTYLDITWTETNPTLSSDDIIIRVQNVTKGSGWVYAGSNHIIAAACQTSRFVSLSMGVTNATGDSFSIELSTDGGLSYFPRMFMTLTQTLPYDVNA